MAELVTYSAVMGAGKSDALIREHYGFNSQDLPVLAIKPEIDTRTGSLIQSRTGLKLEPDFLITPDMNGRELYEEILRHEKRVVENMGGKALRLMKVFVDEAQFLNEQQANGLYMLALKEDIPVNAYGLKADFRAKTFPGMKRLYEVSHRIETLTAICRCGDPAQFNARKIDDAFVFEGGQVAMEGQAEVTYESLCGKCYIEEGGESAILSDD